MEGEALFKLDVVSVRLVKEATLYSETILEHPQAAVDLLGDKLSEMDREVVCVINMNTKHQVINCHIVSMGALNYTVVSPRELFKASILSNADSIILLHNHPSGDLEPSKNDILLTNRIDEVADLIGIPLLDHIIVGWNNPIFYSFRSSGLLKSGKSQVREACAEIRRNYAPQKNGRSR